MDKQANSVRMPPGDRILPACVGAASRRRRYDAIQDDQPPSSSRTRATAVRRPAPAAQSRRPRERPTDGPTEPGVRQSSGALAAWYRWQHSSKDGAADSTTTTDYYAYRLALEQQQQQARTRGGVAAILRELRRTCVSRKPGSARQWTGRWGQGTSRAGWRGSRADGV